MKKKLALIFTVIFCFSLFSGCGYNAQKKYSADETIEIFDIYQKKLTSLAKANHYTLTNDEDAPSSDSLSRYLKIPMKKDKYSAVLLYSASQNSNDAVIGFTIEYFIEHYNDNDDKFDIPFFVEVVNTLSNREITVEQTKEFLEAPESEYSAAKHGMTDKSDKKIYKINSLDFFETWIFGYVLTKDNEANLSFSGNFKELN